MISCFRMRQTASSNDKFRCYAIARLSFILLILLTDIANTLLQASLSASLVDINVLSRSKNIVEIPVLVDIWVAAARTYHLLLSMFCVFVLLGMFFFLLSTCVTVIGFRNVWSARR